jgi:hypothetical protein
MWITWLKTSGYENHKKFGNRDRHNVSSFYNCTIFGNKMNAWRDGSPSKDGSRS